LARRPRLWQDESRGRPIGHQGERGAVAITRGNGAEPAAGEDPYRPAAASPHGTSPVARIAAAGALLAALVLVGLVLLGNGSSYALRANFQDAGGLVKGDDVLIGPARVGSVKSISLTPDGQAQVSIGLDSSVGKLPEDTIARIFENSLSGIANKYVVLEPGTSPARLPDGALITADHTHSSVNLDQLFDTLSPKTRTGLSGFIRGEAAAIKGKAPQASRSLQYFAPALVSTSNVTRELARSEPTFDSLLVQGAQTMQTLASRTAQLSQLVSNTNATTGAIAGQSQSLQQALSLLAPALNHSTSTFAGLRSTLDVLDPLVVRSIPASRRLAQFATGLRRLTTLSIPTVGQLSALIRNPSGGGDLISLLQATPSLAKLAQASFPRMIKQFNDSQAQVDTFLQYTPDVVAALTNLGQIGGYYDANGHYARTQPWFGAFGVDGANQLTSRPPSQRFQGLQVARTRCPGGAVQPAPDGSAPAAVPGCTKSTVPPGP
jgi:phospholipid/cholesterol/gamma-HCH transport system substrate-binding protein